MKKYKVWLHIEEIDEDEDHYMDLEEHTESIGPKLDTIEKAAALKEAILQSYSDIEKIILESVNYEDDHWPDPDSGLSITDTF